MTSTPDSVSIGPVVFVSASIPDPERWAGRFDPLGITDAVVAATRAVFTRGGTILTAAHPTIAPLILQVGDSFPGATADTRVILYQSELFRGVIPSATREMMERSYVLVRWTPQAKGEAPDPGQWNGSLAVMREQMFTERSIAAAVFIGGMEGIRDEFDRVGTLYPDAPRLAARRPGGEAETLVPNDLPNLGPLMDDLYPVLFESAFDRILGRPGSSG